MGIQKDVLVWSSADLSATPTVGSTFTVTGAPDLMAFSDDEGVEAPGDFDPAIPSTIEPNQTLSGTLDGVEFTGNNATTDVFEFEFAFQVTDGTNTFNIYQIDNDQFGGTTVAYVSEVALDPNATYTVLQFDDGVNFDNGTGYETTPVWDDLAGQVDGTSGDDVIGAGYIDDDDDRIDGTDGDSDAILGEGGGDTITAGAGDDLVFGDHVNGIPAGTTEYIAQGFFKNVNFELESGSFNFTDASVSISGDPLEIRFIDNDGVLNGDTASSETPDDTDQLVEINGVLYSYSADYVIEMSGSDGQTYQMLVIDVDRDSSGGIDLYDPTSDPGDVDYENGQILIPRGDVPPPGVTLTAFGPTYDLVNENYSALNGAAVVTNYDDSIDAGAGDDTVFGGQGDDTIAGSIGDDTIYGDVSTSFAYNTASGQLFTYDAVTGTSTELTSGLMTYGDIATTPDGTLYGVVLDALDGSTDAAIYQIDPVTGSETLVYDLSDVSGWNAALASDPDGNLYIADSDALTITRIEPDGGGGFTNPTVVHTFSSYMTDIAFVDSGTAWIVYNNNTIEAYDVDGSGNFTNPTSLGSIPGGGNPSGLALGENGLIYATNVTGDVFSTDPNSLPPTWTAETGTGETIYGVASVPSGLFSSGNDTIDGGAGDDSVEGGAGDDLIYSGTRNIPGEYSEQSGTSDSFTGTNENSDFTGTTSSNEGQVTTISSGGLSGYWLGNGDGDEIHTHSFSQDVAGVRVDFNALNPGEYLTFEIDGASVDLNTLIANGDAIFDGANAYGIDGSGRIIETGPDGNTTTGAVTFLRPLTEIDVISSVDTVGSGLVYEMHVDTNPPTYSDDDVLSGGDGSDTFIIENASGNDTITGGEDADNTDIDEIDASGITAGGVTVTSTNEAGSLSDGSDTISFSEIESFTLTNQDDTFTAWGTSDVTVDAGGGNDTLQGGSGTNSLSGGGGDDVFEVGIGTDVVDGGAGTDTLSAAESDDPISVTFDGTGFGTFDDLSDSDGGSFTSIEAVQGSTGDDTINAAADTGGIEAFGGAGGDSITGGSGDDTIDGGAGNDTIEGGAGADTLTGGAGTDAFVVDDGGDTITDFDPTTGVDGGGSADNDYVDLSAYYNQTTLDVWNLANPGTQYDTPLGWLRADQDDNGNLGQVGGLRILGTDDQPVASSELFAENTGVVCFTKGTHIASERGEVPVEDLELGDLVQTMDHGLQPVRWIGTKPVNAAKLAEQENLRPIRISAGALGAGMPARDLLVSQQHRMIVRSRIARRMFDENEVLVAAKHLVALDGIDVADDVSEVTYVHFLCDTHEIVFANGAPSESLYTGPQALKTVPSDAVSEIMAIFPELADIDYRPLSARYLVNGHKGRKLAMRHKINNRPLMAGREEIVRPNE